MIESQSQLKFKWIKSQDIEILEVDAAFTPDNQLLALVDQIRLEVQSTERKEQPVLLINVKKIELTLPTIRAIVILAREKTSFQKYAAYGEYSKLMLVLKGLLRRFTGLPVMLFKTREEAYRFAVG